MNRLVKGAELSVTASSDMYAKGNTTGDLASNSVNRGGGLLMMTMGRSREELSFNRSGTGRSLGDFGEEDFTEQMLDVGGGGVGGNGSYLDDAKPNYRRSSDSRDDGLLTKTPFLYSHITTANINNMENLDLQLKSLEFRNLFRLPTNETVAVEETSCYYFQKSTLLSVLGNVYLSQDFLCFASLVPPYQSAIQNLPLASTLNSLLQAAGTANIPSNITTVSSSSLVATTLNSLLYDSTCELITAFVIPYPHITSVVKQPPTALPTGGKINTFSISGYLTITTKNKLEYWLSFSNAKSRDKITVELLTRMKNVDWRFDNDIIIGNRNGSIPPESLEKAVALKDSGGGGGSVGKKSTNARDFMFGSNNQAKTKIDLLPVGLRLIYDGYLDNGLTSPVTGAFILKDPKKTAPGGSGLQGPWLEYLEKNGRDTCMVKDLKMIRELIVRTGGIPNGLRGDFW